MTDPTNRPDLAELRRLLEAATPGHASVIELEHGTESRVVANGRVVARCDCLDAHRADADLDCALRNAADWLIRAAEERDALEAKLVEWCQDLDEHIDELESEGSIVMAVARRAEKEDMQECGLWREAPKAGEGEN